MAINKKRLGIVVIPTVLMLGGIITVMVVSGALVVYFLNNSNYGLRLSINAQSAAKGGIQDAVLQLLRDNNYISSGYNLIIDDNSQAWITVSGDLSLTQNVIKKKIISQGSSFTRYRYLETIIQIDKNTGKLDIISIEEKAIP